MADEPNTRMDEVLKAYAGKRRQEAGAPFELHPATRQMLQGEVARTYKQAPRVSWPQRVLTFWPRMAFAATCIVITLTLVLIMLPQRRVMEMAQTTELRTRSAGESRDARTSDKKEAEKLVDAFADAPAPTPSTAPITPSSRPLDRLAKNEADEGKAKSEVMTEARKDTDGVRLLREEAVDKEVARRSYVNKPESSRSRYSQQKQDVQLGARLQAAPAILNNFDLEQTGDKVRVIDEDGSIYVGNVISNDEAKKRYFKLQNAPAGQTGAVSGPAAQELMFYAVGTNVSLRQKVSIEANILQLQTNVANAPGFAPSQALKQNQSQMERGAAQNTIRGRARVGTNDQEMFFEAVPAKP